eukprot:TRINITY_DN657_c0_g1_i2.p1 TRINITY_DN657_c0_g1~~TRINITY_DN657_c0_g1_i2.p1  ORF type:complete len:175 (+),score=27.56 TRINITY_DN657_c0_g1_i2:549-1073(+)
MDFSIVGGFQCPTIGCPFLVDSDLIRTLVEKDTFQQFDGHLLSSCLRQLDDIHYCPVGCGQILQSCYCTNESCKKEMIRRQKVEEERERLRKLTIQSHKDYGVWARNNTKTCPTCYVTIEKNMGCDHMYCVRCKTNFNWSAAPQFQDGASWWKESLPVNEIIPFALQRKLNSKI